MWEVCMDQIWKQREQSHVVPATCKGSWEVKLDAQEEEKKEHLMSHLQPLPHLSLEDFI